MVVWRGDAHDVHARVGQQLAVIHVGLRAISFGGTLNAWPVHITDGNDLNRLVALRLQPMHVIQVITAAAADADEPDAEPLIRAAQRASWPPRRRVPPRPPPRS